MRLEKATKNEVQMYYRKTKLMQLLCDFQNCDSEVSKIILDDGEYSSLKSANCSIRAAIKRYRYPFAVFQRKGTIYLIKL